MILSPVSRRSAPVGGAFIAWGGDLWLSGVDVAADAGFAWDDGPWHSDVALSASAGASLSIGPGASPIALSASAGVGWDGGPWRGAIALPALAGISMPSMLRDQSGPVRLTATAGVSFATGVSLSASAGVGWSIPAATAETQYCYNLRNGLEATQFADFGFLAMVRVNGSNYAVRGGGLYLLGGDADGASPVASSFTLNPVQADPAGRVSRCPWAHGQVSGAASLYALSDADGTEAYAENGPYPAAKSRGNACRFQLGRGIHSALWGFRVSGAARFRVKSLYFDFEPTTRRV